jgi:hypothetical protein
MFTKRQTGEPDDYWVLDSSGNCWVNSNHMLALRCAKYNGTLDQVFERYQQKQQGA